MYTLGINTALLRSTVCICKDDEVTDAVSWDDTAKEAENLMPSIIGMLHENNLNLKDISNVLVVKGPGPFTALRVGVVLANTIAANVKGVSLSAISTFELLEKMGGDAEFDAVVLNAGGKSVFVYRNGEVEIKTEFDSKLKCIGDLTARQFEEYGVMLELVEKELSFEEVCAKLDLDKYGVEELPLLPYYVKDPSITL